MGRRLVAMFAVALIASLLTSSNAAAKTITIATLNWGPYVGEELRDKGFAAEIVREAFTRTGYEVKFVILPWKRALHETLRGKYDAVFPTYYSDLRAKKYIFSEPFAESVISFCIRNKSKITFNNLHDLKRYKIGIVLGFVNPPSIDAADFLQKETVLSDELNIKKLLAKRIDLAVIDKYVGMDLINKLPGATGKLLFLEPPLEVKPMYLAFSRKTPNSEKNVKDFNAGLKMIVDDGTLMKIMKRFGIER